MLARRIEEASLSAWPALQQILLDGWVLRFAKGYTKRANSVNPLYPSTLPVSEKLAACARLYAEKGLPAIFRLTPFSSPGNLDRILEERGYRRADPTRVLYLDLATHALPTFTAELRHEELDAWLATYGRLTGSTMQKHQVHKEILEAIPSSRLLVSHWVGGQAVACCLGVLEAECFGLFDLVTAPQERNKGHAGQLVLGMLAWARANGAAHAYLQVVDDNTPARRLYARLGFDEIYPYWYRIHDALPGGAADAPQAGHRQEAAL